MRILRDNGDYFEILENMTDVTLEYYSVAVDERGLLELSMVFETVAEAKKAIDGFDDFADLI